MYCVSRCYVACTGVAANHSCKDDHAMPVAIDVAIVAILAASSALAILAMNGVALGVFSDMVKLNWRGVTALLSVSGGILFADGVAYTSLTPKRNEASTPRGNGHGGRENHVLRSAKGWEVGRAKGVLPREEAKVVAALVNKVTMTSYNVGMLPGWVNSAQRMGSAVAKVFTECDHYLALPAERAPQVAEMLLESNDDIFCLQELFCPDARRILRDTLQQKYHVVDRIEDRGASFMDRGFISSGLLFASRYPIEEEGIRFYKFTNLRAEDAGADKGLFRAVVCHPAKKMIVYNTHLQAKSGEAYTQIRKDQLESILSIIAEDQKENPETPILLLGDLNVSYCDPKGQRCPESSPLEESFFAHFHDLYLRDHNMRGERISGEPRYLPQNNSTTPLAEPTGSFYNMMTGDGQEEPHQRLDFCLLFKRGDTSSPRNVHTELLRSGENDAFSPRLASDHLPLKTVVNANEL